MARDEHIQELMAKLIRAIESSLAASDAVRDAMKELVQQRYDTRLIFVANAESGSAESRSHPPAVFEQASLQEQGTLQDDELLPDAELQFEMTATDRDFLRSLAIDPDDPPRYESQAAFLKRHGLLTATEKCQLRKVDFKPEVVYFDEED